MRDLYAFGMHNRDIRQIGKRILQRPKHKRQRRTKFVRDIRKEGGLGAIDFRQCFGARALTLILIRSGDRRRDLPGQEFDEPAIALI